MIHSLYCPQKPFSNINYKSNWHYIYNLSTFMVTLLEGDISSFFTKIMDSSSLLCLPSHREVGTCCSTSVPSVCALCPIHFCQRFITYMRHWLKIGLLLAHRLRRSANISTVLGYRVVFDATLNVGSVTDGGPTLTQLWFKASCQ